MSATEATRMVTLISKVMADPRLKASMSDVPFDGKRMIFGGFETLLRM